MGLVDVAMRAVRCFAILVMLLASWQAGAGDGYFSIQGTVTTPGAGQDFLLFPSSGGPVTASTLHYAGGVNLAGETIAGGSFDPTLTISGNGVSGFDDNSGPGADALLTVNLPIAPQPYNLRMQPVAPMATGPWAVDVLGSGLQYLAPLTSNGVRIDSITLGGSYGGGAALSYNSGLENSILSQTAVTLNTGGSIYLPLLTAADRPAIGSLSGVGNVDLGTATLVLGGNGQSTTFAGTISGSGGLIKTGDGVFSLTSDNLNFTGNVVINGGVLEINSEKQLNLGNPQGKLVISNGATLRAINNADISRPIEIGTGGATLDGGGNYLIIRGINGGTPGTTALMIEGNVSLFSLGHPGTLAGNIVVDGGNLEVEEDLELGSTATPQDIILRQGSLTLSDTLAPNRRIVIPAEGGTIIGEGTARLATPNQLVSASTLALVVDRLSIDAANETLSGKVDVSGTFFFPNAESVPPGIFSMNATHALGSANVHLKNNVILELNAPSALSGQLINDGGQVRYNANGAGGGFNPLKGPSIKIGSAVTSVGNDTFDIGASEVLSVDNATPGLLTRGANLKLGAGAIVSEYQSGQIASGVIQNLGTNTDLLFGVGVGPFEATPGLDPVVVNESLVVGRPSSGAPGRTPWAGITGLYIIPPNGSPSYFNQASPTGAFSGTLTADGDFTLKDANFNIKVQSAIPVTVRTQGLVILSGDLGQNNVQNEGDLKIHPGVFLTLPSLNLTFGSGVSLGGELTVGNLEGLGGIGPEELNWISIFGPPTASVGTIRVGLNNASSTYAGSIYGDSLVKFGNGILTLTGKSVAVTSGGIPYYTSSTSYSVEGGTLKVGVSNALPPDVPLTLFSGTTLDLGGLGQSLGSLAGAGNVQLHDGTLRLGTLVEGFSGQFAGPGALVNSFDVPFVFQYPNAFSSDIRLFGGTFRLRGPLGSASPNSITLAWQSILELDNRAGSGGNHLSSDRLGDGTEIRLQGGALRLFGVNAAADSAGASPAPAPPAAGPLAAATMETVGPLSVISGASTVKIVAGPGATATLTSASLGRQIGSTVNFEAGDLGNTERIHFTVPPASISPPNGFLGPWAIANGADFAKYDAMNGVLPFAAVDYSTNLGGKHLLVSASNASSPNNFDAYSLKIDASAADVNLIQQFTTLNLNKGGLLKIGAHAAAISGSGATLSSGTSNELVVYSQGGDLTIGSRLITGALTKSGTGKLVLTGAGTNTVSGTTFVNEGTVELGKSISNATLGGAGILINGGRLQLAAPEQIPNSTTVTINSGSFSLGGFSETIGSVINYGGTFEVGAPSSTALNESALTRGIAAAPAPAGLANQSLPVAAPSSNPSVGEVNTIILVDGTDVVQSSAVLYVGSGGLTFKGGKTPSIVLNGSGLLDLHGDVYVNDAKTSASISGSGNINLNGARIFTPDPDTFLGISAPIGNGSFRKEGAGTLTLSGSLGFSGTLTVAAGLVDVTNPNAVTSTTLALAGGDLRLTLPIPENAIPLRTVQVGTAITVAADATITAQESVSATPPAGNSASVPAPGLFVLGRLDVQATSHLTFASPNNVGLQFGDVNLAALVNLDVNTPVTVTGQVSGAGSLTKSDAGTLTLSGSAVNTFGPLPAAVDAQGKRLYAVTVEGGTLELRKPAGVMAIRGNIKIPAGGTVRLFASDQIADDAAIDLSGTGAKFDLNGFSDKVGSVSVGGGAQVVTGGGVLRADVIGLSGGTLIVGASTVAAALPNGGHAPAGTAVLYTKSFTGSGLGSLDLGNNALVVDYSTASSLTSVRDMIKAGYNSGSGPRIVSSNVTADPACALGYAEASEVFGLSGGSFLSQSVDATSVLVRYTLAGDTNLDGGVGFQDLVKLAQNYGLASGSATWFQGDSNYDGKVDFQDLVHLAQNYGAVLSGGPIPGASAQFQEDLGTAFGVVPEPSSQLLVILAITGTRLKLRRRNPKSLPSLPAPRSLAYRAGGTELAPPAKEMPEMWPYRVFLL